MFTPEPSMATERSCQEKPTRSSYHKAGLILQETSPAPGAFGVGVIDVLFTDLSRAAA